MLNEGGSDTNARIADRLQTFLVHQEVANWGKYFLIINRNVLDFKLSQTGQSSILSLSPGSCKLGETLLIEIDWILNQIVSCYRKSQTGGCDHQEKVIYQQQRL